MAMKKQPSPIEITKPYLLIIEGFNECGLFSQLIDKLALTDKIQIHNYDGKHKPQVKFRAVKASPGFKKLKGYAITRDADNNFKGALESLQNTLRTNSQPIPSENGTFTQSDQGMRISIMVIPPDNQNGMLETLCLESVSNKPQMHCVNQLIACLKEKEKKEEIPEKELPKNIEKARARIYFSTFPTPIHSMTKAIEKQCWNLDHACFNPIKKFLKDLAQSDR
ncbi:DUF3226 domain-containing protein [Magnetococcales bacterium HHB-1]